MERDQLAQLKNEYEQHKTNRANVEGIWDQAEKFIDPLGNGSLARAPDSESQVLWKRIDVWDFTPIRGASKLRATIHGTVTNPAVQWCTAEFRDLELQQDQASRVWLEDTIGQAYQALQDSDFNAEIARSFGDLVVYGNSFIVEEPKSRSAWDGLDFTCVPVREGYFEPDSSGEIKKFFRRISWTARQIIDKCGEKIIPSKIREEAEKNVTTQHEVVFCVFQRKTSAKIYDEKGEPVEVVPELRPWGSVYFLADSAEQCGEEGGYYDRPVFHSPWEETAGSQWGKGIGGLVLPTAKLLNALWEMYLGAGEKAVDPPGFISDRAGVSAVDLGPGKWTVARGDIDKIFRLIESGAKFEVTIDLLTRLQSMISQAFHEDELHLKDSPAMTATEAAIRFEVMNRVMGSSLALVQTRELTPILRLTIAMLHREKRLKPMPELVRRKRGEINIVYLGPLSRAQRTDEVSAIERGFSTVAAMRKMGFEEVADLFNAVEAAREIFKRLGVPSNCLRSNEEVAAAMKKRQEMQASAQKAEIAARAGEAAEKAGKARMAMAQASQMAGGGMGGGGEMPQSMPAAPAPMLTPTLPMGGEG